ncbi:hypothetical protein Hanom_Chr04g00382171 [Helianthus anomalus]
MSTTSSSSSHDGGDGGHFAGPSHARQRFNTAVWPEPFLEALATQVAIDAALSFGRLAAAPAIFNLFQVICLFSPLGFTVALHSANASENRSLHCDCSVRVHATFSVIIPLNLNGSDVDFEFLIFVLHRTSSNLKYLRLNMKFAMKLISRV